MRMSLCVSELAVGLHGGGDVVWVLEMPLAKRFLCVWVCTQS